jgi:predicted ribosome quality control (RQC) complex YloA/Tae2 family protein
LILIFQDSSEKVCVLLSCSPDFARISKLKEPPGPSSTDSSFLEYVRAHLIRGSFEGVRLSTGDRQAGIRIRTDEGTFELVLSILGHRSNIYLLSPDKRLIHTLRPLDETRRELQLGSFWTDPEKTLRSEGVNRWASAPDTDYLDIIEQTYCVLEAKKEIEDTARKIENALTKEDVFLKRKISNLEDDLAEAHKAEEIKKRGELLKSILHVIEPGSDAVVARDYETGEMLEIALNPRLSPAQNLESYFARYQKEARGVAMIERQLLEAHSARGEVDGLHGRLQDIMGQNNPDLQLLRDLTQNRLMRKLLARHYPASKAPKAPQGVRKKADVSTRLLPKRYLTEDGLEIWVGRSDEGNDYLSTRLARGNDLFFHLDGYPGSHVVLRTEGKQDAPQNSILAACELAIHFSKLKNAGRADVHVAHIKDVKKPKGAKPGLVYVLRGKTIHLRRNPKKLQNILAARIED